MSVIYQPKGRALEYSPLACNLWTTCTHGCKYCYSPATLRKQPEDFFIEVPARKKIIYELAKDCQKMKGDPRQVLLCFLCDPYQPNDVKAAITRDALEILALYKMTATVLTKGGMRAARDFDLLKKHEWKFGTSLNMINEDHVKLWEPNAAHPLNRIDAIELAHEKGIYTWVSVEPVIYPEESLYLIEKLLPVVDFWKIGKLNHNKEEELKNDWPKFIKDVRKILKGKEYYLKTDLLAWEK
ncbi:MAG: hypothetical protein PHS34_08805 [Candidatus Omnitrophica bacterium]|nr:hypothetical protein [Candidatus Omnitrophota bacterium]